MDRPVQKAWTRILPSWTEPLRLPRSPTSWCRIFGRSCLLGLSGSAASPIAPEEESRGAQLPGRMNLRVGLMMEPLRWKNDVEERCRTRRTREGRIQSHRVLVLRRSIQVDASQLVFVPKPDHHDTASDLAAER